MKKYISILGLLTVLALQSCERIDAGAYTENPENPDNENIFKATEKQSSENDDVTVFSREAGEDNLDLDTGDDDEPRKDKQHWRTVRDSLLTSNKQYDNSER